MSHPGGIRHAQAPALAQAGHRHGSDGACRSAGQAQNLAPLGGLLLTVLEFDEDVRQVRSVTAGDQRRGRTLRYQHNLT